VGRLKETRRNDRETRTGPMRIPGKSRPTRLRKKDVFPTL